MPGTNQTSSENLSHIISDILHLKAPGKRQLESNRACPEVWVKHVQDDDDEEEEEEYVPTGPKDEDETEVEKAKLATFIAQWVLNLQTNGFPPDVQSQYLKEVDTETEDDETDWNSELVRVFLPYYDLEPEDIEQVIHGRKGANGEPLGRCTVKLTNGDEISGSFRPQLCLAGMVGAGGPHMEKHGLLSVRGFYCQGLLHGPGKAVLVPKALWSTVDIPLTLEGVFNESYLTGPVRGLDEKGNLIFMGAFEKGLPVGHCWLAQEGQGWLYGPVDGKGRFSGPEIAYIFPDMTTALLGTFHQEQLVEARASHVNSAFMENDILKVTFCPTEPDAPAYTFCPSNAGEIPCDWLLDDNYEQVTVVCQKSKVEGAGDGLFAKRDLPAETVISYYNGLHISPEEDYAASSCNYQIYVDWTNTEGSPYVDIPTECTNVHAYCASLAHKANHSFSPNCRFVSVHHPRLVN